MESLLDRKGASSRLLITRQHPAVLDVLDREGIYQVNLDYLKTKNGSMTDYYRKLYQWYTGQAARYLSIPQGAEYPIWFSLSQQAMLQPVENSVILLAEVPAEQYLLCNAEAWGYVVNYWYVPLNRQDEEAHQKQLALYGLNSDDQLFLTAQGNFYPQLKRKIQQSWNRIFTLTPQDIATGVVATTWQLRKEWIREVRRYGTD